MSEIRTSVLPFALPDFDEAEIEEIIAVMRSGWITTGPKSREFETSFAEAVGARYAIAVNSGTAAMHLALAAIDLRMGDEVITTPYTFAATAEVVRYFQAKPVFVDIDPETLNIDPARIEAAVTPKTRAIMPVHIAGHPADMDALMDVAKNHDLRVIEDAAHAFPAAYKGRKIGAIGDFSAFSFYATKTITTAEGGMMTTDNPDWAERCRVLSLHGISHDPWNRYAAEGSWYYEIVAPGYKYNMTDVAAAMGVVQLRKAEQMRARRLAIAEKYSQAFGTFEALHIPVSRSEIEHAWQLYILRLNSECLTLSRAQFIEELKVRKIGCSVHFIPLHIHPYYRETYGYAPADYPVSLREYEKAVSLPIYSRMTDNDVDDVIHAVMDIVNKHKR